MQIEQCKWIHHRGWETPIPGTLSAEPQLVWVFGSTALLQDPAFNQALRLRYPHAHYVGCSTAGEICGTEVLDDTVVVTAVWFRTTQIQKAHAQLVQTEESQACGETLARQLPATLPDPRGGPAQPLVHVFVLSDGLNVNGSHLVKGIKSLLPPNVTITGGLAADGARFHQTLVLHGHAADRNSVVALGFYGHGLKIGYGSLGGWDSFGPERLITKSKGNVLYTLDGQSALTLYKKYLGEHAAGLPGTGLLFPLSIRSGDGETPVVRTILSVDEKEQSMTFAGDVPEGSFARLMCANFDRLIDGAHGAAEASTLVLGDQSTELAILISCVGRKLVLKQRVEEEVEEVRTVLGRRAVLTGFYSYGEISPFTRGSRCELHNQTMTITTFAEP